MKHYKIFIKILSIFCVFSVSLFVLNSCAPADPIELPSTAITGSLESHNWRTSCLAITGGSVRSYTQMSAGIYTSSVSMYVGSGCATAAGLMAESGSYTLTAMNSIGSGNINWTLGTLDFTPQSTSQAASFNTSSFCGYTDWQANVSKSLLGRTCDTSLIPSAGATRYDIYNIAQFANSFTGDSVGDLTFGLTDSTHDGSTEVKRPTTFDGSLVYKVF